MLKKIITLSACAFMMLQATAQKSNIQSAINYLKDNDLANAKKMIDEAVVNESTKSNAKAWLLKGVIYEAIAIPKEVMPQLQFVLNENLYTIDLSKANEMASTTPNAGAESIEAFKKSMALDPKYSADELLPLLTIMVGNAFNTGIVKMNDNKFEDASKSFGDVVALSKLDNGKVFKGNGQLDTVFANSRMYQANCAFNTSKYDEALPLLEECLKNPITQSADMFIMVTDIYETKSNEAKWLETMKAAKAKFPNDKRILNNEINYYLKSGRSEESIAKLKEGIAADPKKADLYIILGQTYYNMANPVDSKTNKPLAKPANGKEWEQNALTNYTKAAELDPKNAYPQFYLGLFYYNQAKEATDEMNKADDKKYAAMKPVRDGIIEKSIPYLDNAKSIIEASGTKDEDKEMYKQVLSGLNQANMIVGKTEKAAEYKKILDGLK